MGKVSSIGAKVGISHCKSKAWIRSYFVSKEHLRVWHISIGNAIKSHKHLLNEGGHKSRHGQGACHLPT